MREGRGAGPGLQGAVAAQQVGPRLNLIKSAGAGEVGRACWQDSADEGRLGSKPAMFSGCADGDGRCELVVGYTDRVVRAFRWEDLGDGAEHPAGQLVSLKKWMLEGQVSI